MKNGITEMKNSRCLDTILKNNQSEAEREKKGTKNRGELAKDKKYSEKI